jgi:hypothetical protein
MVGDELAGYRLRGVLGRGGMSVVFEAENPRLGNTVALKVLAPELADDDVFRSRFLNESRLAASLNHPNVIPIYDTGSADGMLYIAMRYVGGADLRAVLRAHGYLIPAQALPLIGQAARALDAAHRRGLVHRDVKPGNLLVEHGADDDPDHVYLTDFGITKHSDSRSGLTHTGEFMGTIDYIAPEQIQGRPVDGRADVYSLGCVLYECLTGRVPFVKDVNTAVIWAHVQEPPPPPSTVREELPPGIDEVIARALAKEPGDRYQTCRELATAAGGALQGAPAGRAGGPETVLAERGRPATGPPGRPGSGSPSGRIPPPAPDSPRDRPPPADPPPGAPGRRRRPRRRAVLGALGVALLVIAAAIGGWVASRGDAAPATASGGMSSSMSPAASRSAAGPHPAARPGALSTALARADEYGDAKGELPPASCQSRVATQVTCMNPVGPVNMVTFRTFPSLSALYAAYVAEVRALGDKSGSSIQVNYGECDVKTVEGEVGWNHNSVHPRTFSLAQSQAPHLNTGSQLAGRVFCTYGSEYQLVWTDNANRMLGVMSGTPHDAAWEWWHRIHHNISLAGSSPMHM